jgi:hypothetical protein
VLDEQLKSVLVFSEKGKFLFKIHKPGKGPGEYQDITDFYVDKENECIILSSSRPAKLTYFDFNGNFLKEYRQVNFFEEFTSINNRFISHNSAAGKNNACVLELSKRDSDKKDCLLQRENTKPIQYSGSFPHIIKNKNTYFTQVFDFNVYQITENQVNPVFNIDYGKEYMVFRDSYEDYYGKPSEFHKYLYENKKVSSTVNFRETEDFFLFSTLGRGKSLFLLSKVNSSLVHVDKFYDKEIGIRCVDYRPHCGDGYNSIFFHFRAGSFKSLILGAKEEGWYKNPEEFNKALKIANQIDIEDNPVLIRYDFKPLK